MPHEKKVISYSTAFVRKSSWEISQS